MCGGEGGCNKDEGGDKGGRGHKMLAMDVRWRRGRGGQMLVVESLQVKRVRGRKNQICVVELVHARRRRGRTNVCGCKERE